MGDRTHGVIIGRFMPPHNGHRYLIDFALGCVDRLTILVGTLTSDPIDGALRYQWMCELFPEADVIRITEENPKARKGSPDSYRIWARGITERAGDDIDFVFASEDYGFRLAEELGAVYVPVDPARTVFPVSATMVRRNPIGNWKYIPDIVRPYFVRKVYVLSEQAGEADALLERLSDHFHTVCVGDYVSYHAERTGDGGLSPEFAVRAQLAAEHALARQAERVLFSASDAIHAWLRAGSETPLPKELETHESIRTNGWSRSRYLICPPQNTSEQVVHDHGALPLISQSLEVLASHGADVRVLTGSAEDRFAQAVEAVDDALRD